MKYLVYIFIFFLNFQLYAQENYRVTKVTFHGNTSFKSSMLRDKMSLRPKSGLKRLDDSNGVSFSDALLENDVKEIIFFYQQRGFIHATVNGNPIDINDRKQTVKVRVTIDEGEAVRVSHIIFHQSDHAHQTIIDEVSQQSRSDFLLYEGSRFDETDFLKDVARLKSDLVNSGFAAANVSYKLDVDPKQNLVAIILNITPGSRYTFGDAVISGAPDISTDLITKQLSFQKGDIFSRQALETSQEQIYALNIFQVVSLSAQTETGQGKSIPIGIKLRKAPRFTHKYGVGWGREDEFRAKVDVQWLRFFGGARRLNLLLKHSALEPYHIDLRFTQPAFFHPHTSLGLNPFLRRQHEPGYKVNRQGSNIYLQRRIKKGVTAGTVYTFERVTLDTTSVADIENQQKQDDLYNKSSITFSVAQNNTNDMFSPSRGFNTAVTVKYSGVGPSTYHYFKGVLDLRHYTMFSRIILATRVKLGHIESQDESQFIPVEDRFFAGGSNSIRGWARHELGPSDSRDKPIGGASLFEGSIELRIPVVGALNSALFWDIGKVWEEGFDRYQGPAHSIGIGIRYNTPIGPIRFDIATPINNQDNWIRWHLSIGEAF